MSFSLHVHVWNIDGLPHDKTQISYIVSKPTGDYLDGKFTARNSRHGHIVKYCGIIMILHAAHIFTDFTKMNYTLC